MREDLNQFSKYCSECGTYYIVAIGHTCRCRVPKTGTEVNEELLSERHSGKLTLRVSNTTQDRV